jgi:sulfite exporter TauE/SafE
MHAEWIIPALLIGLGGSLHCIGMCGPLMFANLLGNENNGFSPTAWFYYQAGRIGMYAIWGALFGWIGSSVRIFGIQQNISLATGSCILIVLLIIKLFPVIERSVSKLAIVGFVRSVFSSTIHSKTPSAKLVGGMLNGILPCGLVYVAWAGAAAAQDPLKGSLFMVFFGLGTLPLLSAVWLFGSNLSIRIKGQLNRWYPLVIGCMALLLILRGMNMGNLFSPSLNHAKEEIVHCAKK